MANASKTTSASHSYLFFDSEQKSYIAEMIW